MIKKIKGFIYKMCFYAGILIGYIAGKLGIKLHKN